MYDPVDTFQHRDFTISIYRDESPSNPRYEFDHLGTLHAQDRRHDSRDKGSDAWNPETDRGVAIPLCYQHDGTLGECDSFDDADGAIYCDVATICREYSCKVVNPATRAKVRRVLLAELEEYNTYVVGDVFGFVVRDESGAELDSCWGFYGLEYCREAARDACPDLAVAGSYAI